jgi:PilZ domain
LAQLANVSEHGRGFLMGLFSLLDALIDVPLQEALHQAGVGPAITGALLGTEGHDGPLRNVYTLVCQYEAGDWKAVSALASKLAIKISCIAEAYSESTLWAQQSLHATVRKANSRRKARHAARGSLQILWEDSRGQEKITVAQLVNVSVSGLQLQLAERIPLQTPVSCSAPKLGITGRGLVRYCNPSKGKYLAGLEFSNGTGWREPD